MSRGSCPQTQVQVDSWLATMNESDCAAARLCVAVPVEVRVHTLPVINTTSDGAKDCWLHVVVAGRVVDLPRNPNVMWTMWSCALMLFLCQF
jgi:hypothetical protein